MGYTIKFKYSRPKQSRPPKKLTGHGAIRRIWVAFKNVLSVSVC